MRHDNLAVTALSGKRHGDQVGHRRANRPPPENSSATSSSAPTATTSPPGRPDQPARHKTTEPTNVGSVVRYVLRGLGGVIPPGHIW